MPSLSNEPRYIELRQAMDMPYVALSLRRTIDVLFSLFLLLPSVPLILLFALLIKVESAGPAFFVQKRVGLYGREFALIKLRSMYMTAERNGPQWASIADKRVTNIGRFIRKTRMDELPQLLHVLRGDMSLIGPRPERPIFTEQFYRQNPRFLERLYVKPGLTGWAQVNGGYDLSYQAKLELDLYYIDNQSFWLDVNIIWKTIGVLVGGKGAR